MCEVMEEIWKDIPGYEGLYQVSDRGRVKSVARVIEKSNGSKHTVTEKLLSLPTDKQGYVVVVLFDKGKRKHFMVHKLVAICFLDHEPDGHKLVVDHVDHNKSNNRLENLRLVSQRENCNHRKKVGTSKYPGVCWHKKDKQWRSIITIDGKQKYLGQFKCEEKAAETYRQARAQLQAE